MEIKRIRLLLVLVLVSVLSVQAQDEVMKQINNIKLRAAEDHLLTEQMMVDVSDTSAVALCTAGLLRQVAGGYTLDDIKSHVKTLVMNRGTKKLVFVYLDRDDLGTPTQKTTPSADKPVKVRLRTEAELEPQVPVSPAKPTVQQTSAATPVKVPADTPAKDPVTPTVQQIPANIPVRIPVTTTKASAELLSQQQPFFMREVMTMSSAEGVLSSLSSMKEKGQISDYGSLSKVSAIDGLYIIILRKQPPYPPACVLSPVIGGQRLNLTSREVDLVENHHGEAAIWVKTKL